MRADIDDKFDGSGDGLIMIVDDDRAESELLEHIVTDDGWRAVTSHNGEDALEKCVRLRPDLVILDVLMPGMDGFEVCRRVRQSSAAPEVYIVMLTGLIDRESRLTGFNAGADDFISKPVDVLELKARVRNIMTLNRYRRLVDERERNISLLMDLNDAYRATLEGWVRALDMRDHATEGHTRRVSDMTVALADRMGFAPDQLQHVYSGALLHDIGKIGVPDVILRKTGPLTDEEKRIIELHPDHARHMLADIDHLAPAMDIPYCHHERWNGCGYPRGLAGDGIPMAARIFAVIDVWDALRSDRPYRAGWEADRTLAHIRELSGVHFDPNVISAFEGLLRDTDDLDGPYPR